MCASVLPRYTDSLCPLTNATFCGHDEPTTSRRKTSRGCNSSLRLLHFAAGQKNYTSTRALYGRFLQEHHYDTKSIPLRASDMDALLAEPGYPHKMNCLEAPTLRLLAKTLKRHIIILGCWNGSRTFIMATSVIDLQEYTGQPPIVMVITRHRHVGFAWEEDHATVLAAVASPSVLVSSCVDIQPHLPDCLGRIFGLVGLTMRSKGDTLPTMSFNDLLTCHQLPEWRGEHGLVFFSVASQVTDRRQAGFSLAKTNFSIWFTVGRLRPATARVFLVNPILGRETCRVQGREKSARLRFRGIMMRSFVYSVLCQGFQIENVGVGENIDGTHGTHSGHPVHGHAQPVPEWRMSHSGEITRFW